MGFNPYLPTTPADDRSLTGANQRLPTSPPLEGIQRSDSIVRNI